MPPRTPVGLPARLALLVVLVAGFLTMHGFFAVSAGPDAHSPTTAVSLVDAHDAHDAHAVGHPVSPAPSPHPADHHDVLVGCVVALVGVAVMALAHLLARRGSLRAGRAPITVLSLLSWVGDHAPSPPPPRNAHRVIRV